MAGFRKMRPPAPPACGLWQGFKKSGGSTGSKEHVCVSPSSIPRSASPRDKADTPPPASPISARPNTPFLALPKAFLSALCGRCRLRFLDAASAFLELARGHLACADSSCWRVCRFAETCSCGRWDSEEASRGTQMSLFQHVRTRTCVQTYTHTCMPTYVHTYIHMHTRATSRTHLHACSGSGKPNADYSPLRKSKRTHTHAFIHACMHVCMHACIHA